MTLLVDFGPATCACTDHALDELYKAMGDPPGDTGIWMAHENPWIRETVEHVTRAGQGWLSSVQNALFSLLGLEQRSLAKADGPWRRWSPEEILAVQQLLASREPDAFSTGDWLQVVDWIIQRYLPEDIIYSDAEYIAVRGVLAGRIEAQIPERHSDAATAAISAVLPTTLDAAREIMHVSQRDADAIAYAQTHAAEHIMELGDKARHRIRTLIFRHENQRALGNPQATPWNLEQTLLDEFGTLNRDWRRVAVTEVGENQAQGMIAGLAPGTRVKRIEVYRTACPWCKSIHGRIMTVVDPSKPDKDGAAEVWAGKTNVGRSASPRKRVGDDLIERTPDEMYWVAAGLQHPHCRGFWRALRAPATNVDPKFAKWLAKIEAEHSVPPGPEKN